MLLKAYQSYINAILLHEALEVGVSIEEKDIADLEALIKEEELSSDVENLYNRLLSGSYNHLNAFNRQLDQ